MSEVKSIRILFVAEAVTLAHVARPLALAQSLDPNQYEIHFASAKRFDFAFQKTTFQRWEINSISTENFLTKLASGARLYDLPTLSGYVEDDLRVIRAVAPDLIVGDFRLSLAVSATVAKIPYAAIANAYWSPYSTHRNFPLPELAITRIIGHRLPSLLFGIFQPIIFEYHARPLNKLRRKYGLPKLGNLLRVYTYGDLTLYADLPTLAPTTNLPTNHIYLGPITWSPAVETPPWWDSLDSYTPAIFVSLGSSGDVTVLPRVVEALKDLPIQVMLATAGRWKPASLPGNVHLADYLPGDHAAQRAAIVICNGGSPSVYQAMKEGVPVIGIASNMDQLLAMSAVAQRKAGILLRTAEATHGLIRESIKQILADNEYKKAAHLIAGEFSNFNAAARFITVLNSRKDQ